MAFKTVGNLQDSVAGLLTGTNLNNITNINGALERAARTLVQKADIPEASGREAVTLYSDVFDYPTPATMFGTALVDVRPQGVSRTAWDYPYKLPVVQFDRTKHELPNGYKVAFEHKKGIGRMRIASPKPFPKALLDAMSDTTGWTAAGSASGLTQDRTVFYEDPASLRFSLAGASIGTLEKAIPQIDLGDYEDVGVAFLAIYSPSAVNLTSVSLRLGSSSANYNSVTATEGFLDDFVANEWQLIALDFSTASQVGTPDWGAIDYAQVRVNHAASLTNFRVGGLWLALPSPHEVLFQSAAIFEPTNGEPSATIADASDQIILNDAAYTLLEYEGAKAVAMQMSGGKYTAQIKGFDEVLDGVGDKEGLYAHYRADNPSDELRTTGNWYDD